MIHSHHCSARLLDLKTGFDRQFQFVFAPFNHNIENAWFLKYLKPATSNDFVLSNSTANVALSISESEYIQTAETIISDLQSELLNKIVYSRIVNKKISIDNPYELFECICDLYPDTFKYLLYIPGRLCWLGASPELLLSEEHDSLHTIALAGTQAIDGRELSEITWENKEIQEHAFIEEFLDFYLTQAGIAFEKSDTYTAGAGEICHIRSDYKISGAVNKFNLLKTIHPGPALSGFPKEQAIQYINRVEKHKRSYYTGFLGPIHSDTGLQLYANLRCMSIHENEVNIYVGGGITKDSIASKEWHETEMKAKTMIDILEAVKT